MTKCSQGKMGKLGDTSTSLGVLAGEAGGAGEAM